MAKQFNEGYALIVGIGGRIYQHSMNPGNCPSSNRGYVQFILFRPTVELFSNNVFFALVSVQDSVRRRQSRSGG